MKRGRLEAFSDGVPAIIITIMVLELKIPHGHDWAALRPLIPVGLSYVLSFIYVGIYWNNHHHLMHTVEHVDGRILWANLHLLFWLSLIPVTTAWLGESHFAQAPAILYGLVLCACGAAYTILTWTITAAHGPNSHLKRAVGSDVKGQASVVLYILGIAVAFWQPLLAALIYAGVACVWLIPDRRIAREIEHAPH